MPQESRILSMDRNTPRIVIEGMENVLEMDLAKNRGLVEQAGIDLQAFREARSHEMRKKEHYERLVKDGKYNATSMKKAIAQSEINIRHLADKVKLSQERVDHHQTIVNALEVELATQRSGLKYLKEQRANGSAN